MAVRASVNQVVQIGLESTHGTTVAAGKLLEAFTWTFGSKPVTKQFTASGRKHPGASELLYEQSAGKISGQGCYQTLVYPISGVWGSGSPALHGASSTAYDWIWTPALSGAYSPKTYTLQNGDSNDAEQYGYVLFTGFGYSFGRKTEVSVSGDWISQTFTDSATLTSSPTAIAQYPQVGAHGNIYLDSTSGGIGGTLITQDVLKFDFKASGLYGPYYPINRSNASFASHLDLMPKYEVKILMAASSAVFGYKSSYLDTGTRAYLRCDLQGPTIDAGNSIKAEMIHDMALFMTDWAELTDSDGAYAVETTWAVAEDTAWNSGQSQQLTLTNLLSAL